MVRNFTTLASQNLILGFMLNTGEPIHISINEVLDLLAEFGIESSIRYDDYFTGFENLKKLQIYWKICNGI